MNNQIAKLLFKVLKAYGILITRNTIEHAINMHPEFPSMRSISDALDSWKIKHQVMKLTMEKLYALDVPVIAQMKRNDYVWVTQITDSNVHFWDASNKEKIENRAQFEKEWSGIALAIENITDAGESDYKNKRFKLFKEKIFRYSIAGGCIALLSLLTFFSWINDASLSFLPKFLLLFVNATGCFISYILIRQEKNQSNKLIQKFCKAGAHIDCRQVTKSKYSKLFGLITWAETGMVYFSVVTLWVAIAPLSADWTAPLWWLLLVPLPFTVWSLCTQAFLIRKWCIFCCFTVFLLWINAGVLYFFLPFTGVLPVVESALQALLVLVFTTVVMYINKTGKSGDPYSEQRDLARLKYNYQTLKSQLAESPHQTKDTGFTWGNPQSSQEIALYVSIACSHCGTAVKEIRKLMDIYPDLSCRVIFAVYTDDFEHRSNIIIRHFISLYKTMNQHAFFDMLDAWYTLLNKNLEALQKAFPVASNQDNKEEMDAWYQFSKQAKISYTPAILINGMLLSQLYSYGDLYGIARTLYAEKQQI